nr:site-2 protease family protein [Candidatus Njordarchaeum guaymaensis]
MSSELPPYSTTDATRSISFTELSSIVGKHFKVIQGFIDVVHGGIPTFIVEKDKNPKVNFEKLKSRLNARSLLPILRDGEEKGQYALRIISDRKTLGGQTGRKRRVPVQLILLIATVVSVTIAGYFISQTWFQNTGLQGSLSETLVTMVEYATALMAILTVHELGHIIASRIHMMKSSLPYFIPAPPIIPGTSLITPGTFGAVITQTDPFTNRDQLFDLGIAGPFSGFIVAIIVTFMGVSLSQSVPAVPGEGILSPPIMMIMISFFPGKFLEGYAISLHPLGQAGYLGLIITALNLFPVSQLDGGHISRAAFGPRGYERASTISLLLLLFFGLISPFFLPFALLLLFFSFGGRHPGPLDDVSRITAGRKVVAIVGFIVLFLSLPMEYLKILQFL